MSNQKDDNMNVFLRVRPFNQKQSNYDYIIQSLNDKQIKIKDKESEYQFDFDHIFNEQSTQQQVYQKIGRDVIQNAFEGFNGTIFAYGQTSSGKTHTCVGLNDQSGLNRGILPRLIEHIFTKIAAQPPYIEFRIKISMVEIYLQKIRDLFDNSKFNLKIRQQKNKGVYIQDVTEEYVASAEEALKIYQKGALNRSIAQTMMSVASSRSHMIFTITLYQNNLKDVSAKSGKVILVDLAGSEKISKTQAQGKVLDQAKHISKSLSALGNVINALTNAKISHVPYRDSALTRMLQQSLGGNSKTRIIITISPSSYNFSESLTSIRFGQRAKQVKNRPRVNRQYTVAQLLILLEKAQKRIEQLEKILNQWTSAKKKSGKYKGPTFMQNLLDSDAILSGLSENQGQTIFKDRRQLSGIKQLKFQSQAASEDQNQIKFHTPSKFNNQQQSLSQKNQQQQLQRSANQWNIQKAQLLQTIHDLTIERNQSYRQSQLFQQKFEIASKQARLFSSKISSLQKQNQKLLEKLITLKLQTQDKQSSIDLLSKQIESYEQSIKQMIQAQNTKVSKVFGTPQKDNKNLSRLIEKFQSFHQQKYGDQQHQDKVQDEPLKLQLSNLSISQQNSQLKKKLRQVQGQISIFKGLQQSKLALIKQKLLFIEQRQRIYKDLQNRVQKVLQLQQNLDELKQKNKFISQIISSSQSEKGRKILILQKNIDQISENYYVLKGQQSSWISNNKRYEKKIQKKENKIKALEHQIIELKAQVEMAKQNHQEYEQDTLGLDFQTTYQVSPFSKDKGNIVKVLRSSQFYQN